MHGRDHLDDALRLQDATAAVRRRSGTHGPSRALHEGGDSARQLLALQRAAGNSAAARWVNGTTPGSSTTGSSLSAAAEKVGDLTSASDANNQFTGASAAGTFRDPSASTNAAQYGGVAGSGIGTLTSATGLVGQSVKFHRAHMLRKNARPGTAAHRAADVERKAGAGGTAEQGLSFVNMTTGFASAVMNLKQVAQAAVSGVAAASSGVGVAASAVQSVRFIRKADRARQRVERLRTLMADEDRPSQALRGADKEVEALQKAVIDGTADLDAANIAFEKETWEQARRKVEGGEPDYSLLVSLLKQSDHAQVTLDRDRVELQAARSRQRERESVSGRMREALREQTEKVQRYRGGAAGDVSLREIQEYAAGKNSRGVTMKAVSAVAGLLGIGGSIASMIAGIAMAAGVAAGASVLVATPVGWGLAGAAATVALGVTGWKAWRFFQHRWQQTAVTDVSGEIPSTGRRLRRTLAFWRALDPNERTSHAAALYEMARDETKADRATEARRTLVALGLNWDEMRDDPKNGKKLIAAKLASA